LFWFSVFNLINQQNILLNDIENRDTFWLSVRKSLQNYDQEIGTPNIYFYGDGKY